VRIGAEGLIGIDAVVVKVPAASESYPGIARADHMGASVKGKNEHRDKADDHRPAGERPFLFLYQIRLW
jgi:hypothetical protein